MRAPSRGRIAWTAARTIVTAMHASTQRDGRSTPPAVTLLKPDSYR